MRMLFAIATCLLSSFGLVIVTLFYLTGCAPTGKNEADPASPWHWLKWCARDKSGCVTPGQESKE